MALISNPFNTSLTQPHLALATTACPQTLTTKNNYGCYQLNENLFCFVSFVQKILEGIQHCSASIFIHTPSYIHRVQYPGIIYSPRKIAGLALQNNTVPDYAKFETMLNGLNDMLNKVPAMKKSIEKDCPAADLLDVKGCVLSPIEQGDLKGWRPIIKTPSIKTTNHIQTINYLRSWLLHIDNLTIDEIQSKIQSTHELLFKGIPLNNKGLYRKQDMTVNNQELFEKPNYSVENFRNRLKKRGATKNELNIFDQLVKEENWTEKLHHNKLTLEQKNALLPILFFPCSHNQVNEQMSDFITELKNWFSDLRQQSLIHEDEVIELSAFAHRKIAEIHPFDDGNGRIARALMNSILLTFGFQPIVFLDHADYHLAVIKDLKGSQPFANYLKTQAALDMKKQMKNLESWNK